MPDAQTLINPTTVLLLAGSEKQFGVLDESQIRSRTGCNVVAICDRETTCINPEPAYRLNQDDELIVIGKEGALGRFFRMHPDIKKVKV